MAQYEAFPENNLRPTVSLVRGENRRKNVHDALEAVDDGIRPVLKTKKYVIIKPNIVAARAKNALSATNPDELHGILDYLAPRFKGPIAMPNPRRATPGRITTFWSTPRWSRNTATRRSRWWI